MIELVVHPDADSAAAGAADHLVQLGRSAIEARGRFTLAVSGGTTPTAMVRLLAHADLDWSAVHVFQVDERVAPDGDADRNATSLATALAEAGLPATQVHLMDVTNPDLDAAAAAYGRELTAVVGEPMALDVVHLGLGADGHTASWPPGDPVIEVTDRDVAVVSSYRGRRRLTLTPPAVNRARNIVWLVTGPTKRAALIGLLDGDPTLPASRVESTRAVLHCDRACDPGPLA